MVSSVEGLRNRVALPVASILRVTRKRKHGKGPRSDSEADKGDHTGGRNDTGAG